MLLTTHSALQEATGLSPRTIGLKLKGLPFQQLGRFRGFSLVDAIPRVLGTKLAPVAPNVVKQAVDSGATCVGGLGCIPDCLAFELWLKNIESGQQRLAQVRRAFGESLAATVSSGAFYADYEAFRTLLVRHSLITPFLITGATDALPRGDKFDQFAREFAILHADSPANYQRLRA